VESLPVVERRGRRSDANGLQVQLIRLTMSMATAKRSIVLQGIDTGGHPSLLTEAQYFSTEVTILYLNIFDVFCDNINQLQH